MIIKTYSYRNDIIKRCFHVQICAMSFRVNLYKKKFLAISIKVKIFIVYFYFIDAYIKQNMEIMIIYSNHVIVL